MPRTWDSSFRTAAAVVALAGMVAGQGVRVVFDDGRVCEQVGIGQKREGGLEVSVLEPIPGRFRVRLRNPGKPEWQVNSPQVGDRVWLKEVWVGCPSGFHVEWAGPKQAVDAGFEERGHRIWQVLGDRHRRSVFPLIPESKRKHVLTGGEAVAWDLVQGAAPLPDRHSEVARKCRALLWTDERFDRKRWPERVRLQSLWRVTPSSFDPRAEDRDMGWRMYFYAARFANNADGTTRVPEARGPFDWGGMPWVDGQCAQHYDLPRWCVDLYLETGDQGAWELAYLMARYWAFQCFIWTDVREPYIQHAIRYEKGYIASEATKGVARGGELGRPGNAGDSPPRLSHMWDTGARLVAHLSQDVDLLEVCRLRGEAVLATKPHLSPNGCRGFAWNLENATAHGVMSGDPRFKAFAEAEVRRAVAAAWPLGKTSTAGVLPAFPSEPRLHSAGLVEWDPWQHAAVVGTIYQAAERLGFALDDAESATLSAIAAHTIERGTRFLPGPGGPRHYLQGCMFRDRAPNPRYPKAELEVWQGPAVAANFLPALWFLSTRDPERYGEAWRACARSCGELVFTGFGGRFPPPEVQRQADSNHWGAAGHKAMADLGFARPAFFVPPAGVAVP